MHRMHTARNTGRFNQMILSIIPRLLDNERIAILECKDPKDIINRLDNFGLLDKLKTGNLEVKYEPIVINPKMKPIYKEENGEIVVDFINTEKKQSGYVFYVQPCQEIHK